MTNIYKKCENQLNYCHNSYWLQLEDKLMMLHVPGSGPSPALCLDFLMRLKDEKKFNVSSRSLVSEER